MAPKFDRSQFGRGASQHDHAHVLNISAAGAPTAAAATKAFRTQSLLVHPDKCPAPEAEEAFKRVHAAYVAMKEQAATPRPAAYGGYGGGGREHVGASQVASPGFSIAEIHTPSSAAARSARWTRLDPAST